MEMYNKHYVRLDTNNYVIKGFSDAFEQPLETDICINLQAGRQFELLGDINPNLFDGFGCSHYKAIPTKELVDGVEKIVSYDIAKTSPEERNLELDNRITLEQLKEDKINELSFICNKIIELGIDVETATGTHHYSLKIHDQLEILAQTSAIQSGATAVPYHADGEGCKQYTAEEFMVVSLKANAHITYNRTYFNQAKKWVQSLATKADVKSVQWGDSLPKEFDDTFKLITGISTINTGV